MSTPPDGRSTRWDEHRLLRRTELVESTLRAIRQHGATVGMDDIAAVAGTSKTVFYRHFTDRAGLYAAVAERVDALILRDLGAALGEPTAQGGRSRFGASRGLVAAAIDSYLRLVERDPEVYRFIINAPLLEHVAGDPARPVTDHVSALISAVIADALGTGGEDATGGAATTAAAAIWGAGVVGMVRAGADRWLADPEAMSRQELSDHLTTLAWSGISAAWPSTPDREGSR